jgi:hypothetical protein
VTVGNGRVLQIGNYTRTGLARSAGQLIAHANLARATVIFRPNPPLHNNKDNRYTQQKYLIARAYWTSNLRTWISHDQPFTDELIHLDQANRFEDITFASEEIFQTRLVLKF